MWIRIQDPIDVQHCDMCERKMDKGERCVRVEFNGVEIPGTGGNWIAFEICEPCSRQPIRQLRAGRKAIERMYGQANDD